MGKLQVLPVSIANMIAAGEVVGRPASVVKELMENAVDAGADKIDVIVTDAGRTLIQVIDNGCGMSPEDATLCFERHATSKIASAEDLEAIRTYGFRGEALASIAAVAEVNLKTRRKEDETATRVHIGEFGSVESGPCAAPYGSNFEIRNLFYNTPARRKFLKSDNVELKHIIEEFTRIAMIRPSLAFSLSHNGKDLFVLKKANSLKFRILDLLGKNVAGDLVDISSETSIIKVSGFLGKPEAARKTLGNQFFFINGRFFRSSYLHRAVMKAYEEMTPEGMTPSYFIFLETDPHGVDVNIHPTKTEVKFEDEPVVFQIIYACVREVLGRNSFGASIDFETEGEIQMPVLGGSFAEFKPQAAAPMPDLDLSYDPFADFSAPSAEGQGQTGGSPAPGTGYHAQKRDDYGALFEEKAAPMSRVMILQGKYIVTPAASGMMVVNVRRARERIFYDRALKALKADKHVTQTAMFPVTVQVGTAQRTLFDGNAGLLASLGFDIAPEGTDSIVVGGVPEGFSCEPGKISQLVEDLVLILSDGAEGLPEMMEARMAEKFATLGATSADKLASPVEAQSIIDTLFGSENAEFTPTGRRIVSIIPMDELDKRF